MYHWACSTETTKYTPLIENIQLNNSFGLIFEVELSLSKEICFIVSMKAFSKRWKMLFISSYKLFAIKIFKFLSWLFGHVEKTGWQEALV